MSNDASKGRILRKWDKIETGYQAHEITDRLFTGGISGIYGNMPENLHLRLFGNFKPFGSIGGEVYGVIGTVKDTRNDT